ncbi:Hypp4371 [Branchiostoma lanceolatum]|uniref:Hypp4371 protein n=1 Tax=Branchiostoma lanceolatum TaxID=7740 RepID=A0A8K0A9E5_BRALA|nr:Hypp4371 [Branchiostoma lanceolatum]
MGIDVVTREAVEQILKQPVLVERIQKFYREHGFEPHETQVATVQPDQQAATPQPASMLETQQASVVQQAQAAGLQQAAGLGGSEQPQVEQAKVQLLAQLINMGVVQPTDLAASQPELAAASIVQAARAATEVTSSASAAASTQQSVGGWVQSTPQTQATSQTQANEPLSASNQFRAEWGSSSSVSEQSDRIGRHGRLSEDTPDVSSYDVRSRGLTGEPARSRGVGLLDEAGLVRDPARRAHPEALRDAPPRDPYRRGEEYPDRRDRGERGEWDRYERERLAYERDRRERELYEQERRRRRELDEWDGRRGPVPREYDERYRGREPPYPGREERERELEEWARSRRQFDPQGSGDPGRGHTDRAPAYGGPRPSHYDRPGHFPQQDSQELYDPEAATSDAEEDAYDAEEEDSVNFAKSLLPKVNVPAMAPELVEDALRSPEVLEQLRHFRQKNAPAPVVASYLQVMLAQYAASPSAQQSLPRARTQRGKRGGKLSKLRYFQKNIDKLMGELQEVQQMKARLGDRCSQELHDLVASKSLLLNDFKRKALELEQICKEQGREVTPWV